MGDTYDEEKWVYEEACEEWGSKWGVADVKSIYHTPEYVNFHYESAWNMPNGLFDGLQEKYGVRIYSHGYEEGCGFYTAYANGKCDTYHYDQSDFDKWVKDKGINLPDYEKEPEEYREAYDDKILDFLDDKGSWLVQELNGGNSIFKTHPVGEY
jgi:hypothetical protein